MSRKNISQEKIIQSFLASAFEKGAGATSLADISDSLEIKKASLYNHFAGRDDIYEETLSAKYSAECCSGGGEKETRVNHFSRRENVYEFPLFSSRHIQKSSLTPTCCCC